MLNYVPYGWSGVPTTALTASSQNATANWTALGFVLPAAKTLSKVRLFVNSKTGSPIGADCQLDIYSNSSAGLPNASLANAVLGSAPTASAWSEWTGFSLSLSEGVQYWLVLRNLNASPAANFIALARGGANFLGQQYGSSLWGPAHRQSTDSGATWATSPVAGAALFRLEFGDGTFFGAPIQSAATTAVGVGVYSGRKLGNWFTTPSSYPLKVIGAAFPISKTGTPTVNHRYEIYAGTSLVATSDEVNANNTTASGMHHALFAAAYTLLPSTVYRVVIGEPSNADASTNRWNSIAYTVENDANSKALIPNTMKKTYFDGSSWTETDTDFIPMQLLLDPAGQFAASGGAPVSGNLRGGFVNG